MMNSNFAYDLYSLPARSRFGYWQEVVCKLYSPAENSTNYATRDFQAKVNGFDLGPLVLSRVKSKPFVSTRNLQSLRRDPLDCFFVTMLESGHASIEQRGRQADQGPGDLVLYDSSQPFVYDLHTDYEMLVLRLPRQIVEPRFDKASALTARRISTSSPVGKLAGKFLREATKLDLTTESPVSYRLAMTLVDLLSVGFEMENTAAHLEGAHQVNHLDQAKSYIRANLEDPELEVDTIAQALSVSRRTLNRLFAREGTTPTRWLWEQRLAQAKIILDGGTRLRVVDVAFRCGFKDVSHFGRAFKAQYGVTPRTLLGPDA